VRLSHGPRENHHRPAIDPLFRTAARAYGPRVIGVVLSGSLGDGTAGLMAIRNAGGLAVVQDPADALMASMPTSAREMAGADHVLAAAAIGPLLARLTHGPIRQGGDSAMTSPLEHMPEAVDRDMAAQEGGRRRGQLTVFTCPECGGALWQADEQQLNLFRCHVGHAYYGETLLAEQSQALEAALWTAVRTFKEKTVLARQLATAERARGREATAQCFEEEALVAERYGEVIQRYLLRESPPPSGEPVQPGDGHRGGHADAQTAGSGGEG
jgi:two-component system chemotaxis response regulator CheB